MKFILAIGLLFFTLCIQAQVEVVEKDGKPAIRTTETLPIVRGEQDTTLIGTQVVVRETFITSAQIEAELKALDERKNMLLELFRKVVVVEQKLKEPKQK